MLPVNVFISYVGFALAKEYIKIISNKFSSWYSGLRVWGKKSLTTIATKTGVFIISLRGLILRITKKRTDVSDDCFLPEDENSPKKSSVIEFELMENFAGVSDTAGTTANQDSEIMQQISYLATSSAAVRIKPNKGESVGDHSKRVSQARIMHALNLSLKIADKLNSGQYESTLDIPEGPSMVYEAINTTVDACELLADNCGVWFTILSNASTMLSMALTDKGVAAIKGISSHTPRIIAVRNEGEKLRKAISAYDPKKFKIEDCSDEIVSFVGSINSLMQGMLSLVPVLISSLKDDVINSLVFVDASGNVVPIGKKRVMALIGHINSSLEQSAAALEEVSNPSDNDLFSWMVPVCTSMHALNQLSNDYHIYIPKNSYLDKYKLPGAKIVSKQILDDAFKNANKYMMVRVNGELVPCDIDKLGGMGRLLSFVFGYELHNILDAVMEVVVEDKKDREAGSLEAKTSDSQSKSDAKNDYNKFRADSDAMVKYVALAKKIKSELSDRHDLISECARVGNIASAFLQNNESYSEMAMKYFAGKLASDSDNLSQKFARGVVNVLLTVKTKFFADSADQDPVKRPRIEQREKTQKEVLNDVLSGICVISSEINDTTKRLMGLLDDCAELSGKLNSSRSVVMALSYRKEIAECVKKLTVGHSSINALQDLTRRLVDIRANQRSAENKNKGIGGQEPSVAELSYGCECIRNAIVTIQQRLSAVDESICLNDALDTHVDMCEIEMLAGKYEPPTIERD